MNRKANDMLTAQRAGQPRRLLIFIHSLRGGGAERVAAELAAQWARRGWQVTVVTQTDTVDDAYPLQLGVRREVLGTAGSSGGGWNGMMANVRRLRRLRRLLQERKPDIVLGMMRTSSILAILAARGLPCRVLATEHTHPPAQPISRLWRWLRRRSYPKASRVVALTRSTANWLESHIPGTRTAVIPNPVQWPLTDMSPWVAPPPAGRKVLLAVGRLHYLKGFDILLEAFANVADKHPDWDLWIAGEGNERTALDLALERLGLRGRVHLPGRVGNIGDWYQRADLYVLSSRVEGLSNTLLEAMASGCAVLACDCDTGPREIIQHEVDGVLVQPAGDSAALAQALDALMPDDERRARLAQAGLSVRERFSVESILGRWENLFEEVSAEPLPPAR
ncbi:glycosyltransferase family 4 protein [Kerstersia sp.]|uniref:glycosyltransferase family 4 protein n=1 Tax=Kerstersia sp. TaxID=1930783 RepID=UPI003F93037E